MRLVRRGAFAGLAAMLILVALGVTQAAITAAGLAAYWQGRAREPIAPDAFRLVALGDSAVMAVGASDPMDGFVGRIAHYVADRTGRPVHIVNVSSGGTTADVLADQVPNVDLRTADLVVVADSNDLERGVPLDEYRAVLTHLMEVLPADRTVYSDLPFLPGRDPYQAVLAQVADAHGVARADFAAVFNGPGRRLDVFSWLPPHLNSKGYGFWFDAFRPAVDRVLARSEAA